MAGFSSSLLMRVVYHCKESKNLIRGKADWKTMNKSYPSADFFSKGIDYGFVKGKQASLFFEEKFDFMRLKECRITNQNPSE